MTIHPTHLERLSDAELLIEWSDGHRRRYPIAQLREECPCASCRERRAGGSHTPPGELPVLSLDEAAPLRVTSMKPVGNYAYSIDFSDGHDSGIYTFELLRSLGREADAGG